MCTCIQSECFVSFFLLVTLTNILNWRPYLVCSSVWANICLFVILHKFMEVSVEFHLFVVCLMIRTHSIAGKFTPLHHLLVDVA